MEVEIMAITKEDVLHVAKLGKLNLSDKEVEKFTQNLSDIVGWANVSMVEIYDDTDVDDKLGKYFDENGIKKVETKTLSDL
jgi:Asp-tRNA(Asn)/Glu-tRNA(Gln) amidotransferase C subunit